MERTANSRISVLRDDGIVPLIPDNRAASQRSIDSTQPWNGILLERHLVHAIEIPHHAHREFCLHLQLSGNSDMEWWSEGRHGIEKTAPGSLILLPPGTEDRLRWQGTSERLILSLQPNLLVGLAEEMQANTPIELPARWSLNDSSLQQLVASMGREAAEGWPLGSLYADLLAAGLATQLLRKHVAQPVSLSSTKASMPMPRLRHALEYITAHLHHDVRLEEIAHELRLSPFHFAHEFRNTTGQTPYQYLLDQRMERAKQLLRTSNWTVQEIATMTGFHSPVNFVRAFRQRIGQTPGAWRKDA